MWPLAKAQSFTVEPSLAGASQAVSTLTPLLPLALLVTWVADGIGLGAAMAGTAALGAGAMALLLKRS